MASNELSYSYSQAPGTYPEISGGKLQLKKMLSKKWSKKYADHLCIFCVRGQLKQKGQ